MSEGIIESWNLVAHEIGSRDMSDHCPIWIKGSQLNWGAITFKSNNCWFENKQFLLFTETQWKSFHVTGKKAFVMKEKLKMLRVSLKKWNKEVFGFLDLKIDKAVNEAQQMIWNNLHLKESLLKQKSRHKWIKEGDLNSRFFHGMLNMRRRRNNIVALVTGSGRVKKVHLVKAAAKEHFEARFSEQRGIRPTLERVDFKCRKV